jgi:hypothetical protein
MPVKEQNIQDRVREDTTEETNLKIDQEIINNITRYSTYSTDKITSRLEKLQKEWDIERALEVNASAITITALLLGSLGRKRWYIVSGVIAGFLLQHGLQGWSPPFNLFRALGMRTRREIDEEIYALRTLRGDFNALSATTSPEEIIRSFRGEP